MNISRLPKQNTLKPTRRSSPFQKLSATRRPFSRVKSTNCIREQAWNNRFIYNKMPIYDAAKDKNVFHHQKVKLSNRKINTVLSAKSHNLYMTSYHNQNNIFKPIFNRTNSGFFSQNCKDCKINYYNNINFNTKNENLENSSEIQELSKLWNELCVPGNYRNLFMIIYKQLIGEERQHLYKKEINELNSINKNIKSLKYFLNLRNSILKELFDLNKKLGFSLGNNKNNEYSSEEILKEISEKIEKLRESTVDVCYSMKKFKSEINIVQNLEKYNLDRLANKFKIDKNYLIKMKSELSFLKEGYIKYFFNIDDDQTPFLLKTSDTNLINEKEPFVHLVPLSNELKEDIIECNYYIYQELIAYQNNVIVNNNNNNKIENIIFNNSNNKSKNYKFTSLQEKIFSKNKPDNQTILKNTEGDKMPEKNSTNSSNIFEAEMKHKNMQNIINQRIFSSKFKKDLFSQKLLSGLRNDLEDNVIDLDEDEKIQNSKENEEEDNEEEEEEENEKEEKNEENTKKLILDKSENDVNYKPNKITEHEVNLKEKEKDLISNVEKVIYEEKETNKENKDSNEKNNSQEKAESEKENNKTENNINTGNNMLKSDKMDSSCKIKNESTENYKIDNNKIESIIFESQKEEKKMDNEKKENNKIENDQKNQNKTKEIEKINKIDINNKKQGENENKDVNKKKENEKQDDKNINDVTKKKKEMAKKKKMFGIIN